MRYVFSTIGIFLTFVIILPLLEASEPVRHDLRVALYPDEHRLAVEDMVTVPEDLLPEVQFVLHTGLSPSSPTPGVRLVRETERSEGVPLESFSVSLPAGRSKFGLEYRGTIHHPIESYGKEQARGYRETPGLISAEGVYLAGSSFWYPTFDEGFVTFVLQVALPPPWDAVSQGKRTLHDRNTDTTSVRWESSEPQEEIHIVAAPFTEYTQPSGGVEAMVFLRTPDVKLATKYLEATVQYLAMYEELVGPYPYGKFALVENFWETGFGMASFTLLGPKIIRFPFILHSSYPHEILHNWWGNSIFPDFTKGNWAEGLTAYLSDHLIREMRGNGVAHRQETLQKYADYVSEGRDFPLTQFRSRRSTSSAAVGYGKCLMFFHMLRQGLGDEVFIQGLRDFFRKKRFQVATFDDLRKSFEAVSGKGMGVDFDQWITRQGAPELRVSRARAEGNGHVLTALLEQDQPGGAYLLRIPIAVTMEGRDRSFQSVVVMEKKRLELALPLPARPLRLDVDPEFDLFRRLDRDELPPALTQALGAKKMLILLPSAVGNGLLEAYQGLSQALSQSGPEEVEVKLDSEVKNIPSGRAVSLFGWENRFLKEIVSALSRYDVTINHEGVRIGSTELQRKNHSAILTARHPREESFSLTWIASDLPEALLGLGQKLPHYHKYSYLGFRGGEPHNVAKGRWPVFDSSMTVFIPGKDGTIRKVERGELAQRESLATLPPVLSEERMMDSMRYPSPPGSNTWSAILARFGMNGNDDAR